MSKIKRKRISKKNKSAWRKTDIKDVEDYLEEQRQEERIGTFSDKKDEDLFQIDNIPDKEKNNRKLKTFSEKDKRKLNAKRPLQSIQSWKNLSKVQDPIKKRNIVKQKKNGRNIEKEISNPTRSRHFQANKDRAKTYENVEETLKKRKIKIPDTNKDLWIDEDFRDKIPGLKDEKGWISKDLSLYITKNLGKPVIKVHDSIRHRTIKVKNKFESPHPGQSYNPSYEDHRKLLEKIVEKEEKIIKQEKHLKRVTTNMFKKVTAEERDELRLKEMCSGLDDNDLDNNTNDNEYILKKNKRQKGKVTTIKGSSLEDNDYSTINPPSENKKKTRQTRNKELRQKQLQQKTLEKKLMRKQIAEINRLKAIKKEVLAEEAKLNELKKKRKKSAIARKYETKRLGRLKYQEPDEDIKMPENLVGNLRNVEPESSLLIDRFKNFQKRNILPVSVATGKRKARKIKRFPRSSHKEPGISYQMLREKRLKKNQ